MKITDIEFIKWVCEKAGRQYVEKCYVNDEGKSESEVECMSWGCEDCFCVDQNDKLDYNICMKAVENINDDIHIGYAIIMDNGYVVLSDYSKIENKKSDDKKLF